jgi:hypothetical protein
MRGINTYTEGMEQTFQLLFLLERRDKTKLWEGSSLSYQSFDKIVLNS